MADVVIDSNASSGTNRAPRSLVFVSADVGYHFYLDSDATFGYSKTTDGGATWGAQVEIHAATTFVAFDVWYDQWTPGDSGTLIHLAYIDSTNDDIFYRTLNTSGSPTDSLGTQRVAVAPTSAVAGVGCFVTLTKTRSGYLYIAFDIDAGAERGLHRSTDAGVNWSSDLDDNFVEATLDWAHAFPASNTGDDNDCWFLYFDASADDLTLKMWDSSAGSATESASIAAVIDSGVDGLAQYPFSGSIRNSDGHLIAAVITQRDNAASDHLVFDINGTGSITSLTAITTDIDDHYNPCIFIDQNTDDLYIAYNGKRDGSEAIGGATKIYYTKSTDDGTTWSAGDTAYSEDAASAINRVWTPLSGSRFCAVWRTGTTFTTNEVNSVTFDAGLPGRTADLSQTLGTVSVSGDGAVAIAAASAQTIGSVSLSGAAANASAASLAQTLGTVELASTGGQVERTADFAQTLGAVTVSAAAANAVSAVAAETLGAVTLTADGDNANDAESAQTLGAVVLTGAASNENRASLTQTLAEVQLEATGGSVAGTVATLAQTLGAVTSTAAANNATGAVLAQTLGAVTSTAAAAVALRAALAQTLGAVTLSSDAGEVNIDLAVTLGAVTLAADATVPQPDLQQAQHVHVGPRGRPQEQPAPMVVHGAVLISGGGSVVVSGHADRLVERNNAFMRMVMKSEPRLEKS